MEQTDNSQVGLVVVQNDFGLHARSAGRLAREASKFISTIELELDGRRVDAKSILDILTLAASKGSELTLRVSGEDCRAAFQAISLFFEQNFTDEN